MQKVSDDPSRVSGGARSPSARTQERWITIGTVRERFVIFCGWGSPHGWEIGWRGRVSWCQPYNFLSWNDLAWAVRRRVELAGLKLVSLASEVKKDGTGRTVLRALVRREPNKCSVYSKAKTPARSL